MFLKPKEKCISRKRAVNSCECHSEAKEDEGALDWEAWQSSVTFWTAAWQSGVGECTRPVESDGMKAEKVTALLRSLVNKNPEQGSNQQEKNMLCFCLCLLKKKLNADVRAIGKKSVQCESDDLCSKLNYTSIILPTPFVYRLSKC